MASPARFGVFVLVCVVQLAVAVSIIARSERVLEEGELLRFRSAPVDPADLVRGRYVALAFEATQGPPLDAEPFVEGSQAYALLERDAEGFARVAGLRHAPPASGPYLTVTVRQATPDQVRFAFPVDRFYLPEEKARAAEQAYQEALTTGRTTWAEIRVRAGQALIEQLLIDGVPIAQRVAGETGEPPGGP